jgi:hypothetical protein
MFLREEDPSVQVLAYFPCNVHSELLVIKALGLLNKLPS